MSYTLKDRHAKSSTLIFLTYYFSGRCIKLSTGERINPREWNFVKCRPRTTAERAATLTKFLDRLEARVKDIHTEMRSNFAEVTPGKLKEAIERDIRTKGEPQTLIGTIQDNSVKELLKSFPGPKDFGDTDSKWLEKFQGYMDSKGYSLNYTAKVIGIIQRASGKTIEYRKPHEESESIYLTEHELLHIYGIELPPYLDKVRNRFIIGAFTGLRFSDSAKITHDSIRQGLLFDKNKKTGENVVVPLHWCVKQIMDAHPEGLPQSISNQKSNVYLKIIGERAGITAPIQIHRTVKGTRITETYRKCDLITTHTARRSAVSNMVLAGIPTQVIMAISGHRTEGSFQKYVKMSKEHSAMTIQNHSYFKEY